jgi:hypothetical protein
MEGAIPIPEESRIIHDSITVLPAPQDKQLLTPLATEAQDSDSDSEQESTISVISNREHQESTSMDPKPQLQDTEPTQRRSSRSTKGTFTSTKFSQEGISKKQSTAKIARSINLDNEDELISIQEAINHPTRGKQWEIAINNEYNSLIKNGT